MLTGTPMFTLTCHLFLYGSPQRLFQKMERYITMNIVLFKKSAMAALTIGFVASGMAFAPANAGTVSNDTIHINKNRLKAKCKRSGGTFTQSGGRYRCSVSRDDGSYTTVNCNKKRNCVGFHNDGKKLVHSRANRLSNTTLGTVAKR